jgi:hypothetical protein
MPRPQFSLKTLLWLMAVVGAFFGGRASQVRDGQRRILQLEDKLKYAARYQSRTEQAWAKSSRDAADEIDRLRNEIRGLRLQD